MRSHQASVSPRPVWQIGGSRITFCHAQQDSWCGCGPSHVERSPSPVGWVSVINAPVDGGDSSEATRTITLDRSADGRLGFSVRGGAEHGLSIFISKVETCSSAARAGLCVGDQLVEVNGVGLEGVTMGSAVKVLTGNSRLRMTVRRVGKLPDLRYSMEKTTWVDLTHRRMVVVDSGRVPSVSGSDGALRRVVHLYTTPSYRCLGFNIRGGREFGLGIYISKYEPSQVFMHLFKTAVLNQTDTCLMFVPPLLSLDPGGLAEQNGIKMGDQILAANGVNFEDISHAEAVETLRSSAHIMLTIKEAGRYPAYKEVLAEYSWLDSIGPSSNQSSDSSSAVSSLSSMTPLSSLSSHPQARSPSPAPMLQNYWPEKSEVAVQTDPVEPPISPRLGAPFGGETTRQLGATVLLEDTAIRDEGPGGLTMARSCCRNFSAGILAGVPASSPKTSMLMALSRPRRPLHRSQSHVTESEVRHKRKQEQRPSEQQDGGGDGLRRSKTFMGLLSKGVRKRGATRGRSSSPSSPEVEHDKMSRNRWLKNDKQRGRRSSSLPSTEILETVETMAKRLLGEDEVAAVMRHCRRFVAEHVLADLVRPLLALLDRPEKVLLLREIRMLIPPADLERFNSVVVPVEKDAYEVLKSRSVRSPALRSAKAGPAPRKQLITPIPDHCGGFRLKLEEDLEKDGGPVAQMEALQLSGAFTPLFDVPLDGLDAGSPRPHTSCLPSGESMREPPKSGPLSGGAQRERGKSPLRNGQTKAKRDRGYGDGGRNSTTMYSMVSAPHRGRPPLSKVFGSQLDLSSTAPPAASVDKEQTNARDNRAQEYELTTVTISKTKQSLGISISGGIESRVQPMVKIEKIFPGGAAATSNDLKAGFELVSVDGETLEGLTHQQAVDVIRRAFSNKVQDPMVFMVKVPKTTHPSPD